MQLVFNSFVRKEITPKVYTNKLSLMGSDIYVDFVIFAATLMHLSWTAFPNSVLLSFRSLA